MPYVSVSINVEKRSNYHVVKSFRKLWYKKTRPKTGRDTRYFFSHLITRLSRHKPTRRQTIPIILIGQVVAFTKISIPNIKMNSEASCINAHLPKKTNATCDNSKNMSLLNLLGCVFKLSELTRAQLKLAELFCHETKTEQILIC